MLSERCQIQKSNTIGFNLYEGPEQVRLVDCDRSQKSSDSEECMAWEGT